MAAGRLRDRVRALRTGEGGVVVVRGDHDAGTAWFVASACDEHDGRSRVGRASTARRRVPLWPLWEAVGDDGTGPTGRGTVEAINQVTAQLLDLTASGPLLVGIEELEHADAWTLAAIEALADATTTRPLLLVVTLSSTGLGPADELVDALQQRDLARCVSVGPLAAKTLRDLVASVIDCQHPPDELVDFVADRSAGLARLAERIVRTALRRHVIVAERGRWRVVDDLERAVPDDTVSSALRGLAAASAVERDLLTAIAVLGPRSTPRLLADAVGCDLDEAVDTLTHAAEHDLLAHGPTIAMRTGIVREATLRTLTLRTPLTTIERIADVATQLGDAAGFDRVLGALQGTSHAESVPDLRLRMALRAVADGEPAGARHQLDAMPRDDRRRRDVARLELAIGAIAGAPRDATTRAIEALDDELDDAARRDAARAIAFRDLDEAREVVGDQPHDLLDAFAAPLASRQASLEPIAGRDDGDAPAALRHLAAIALPRDEAAARGLLRRAASIAAELDDRVETRRVAAALGQLDLARSGSAGRLAAAAWALLQRGDRVIGAELAADAAIGLVWNGHAERAAELATEAVNASIDRAPATGRRAMDARTAATVVLGRATADPDVDRRVQALSWLLADAPDQALEALAGLERDDPGPASIVRTQLAWLEQTAPLLRDLTGAPAVDLSTAWRWTPAVAAWDDLTQGVQVGARGQAAAAQAAFTNADALLTSSPVIRLLARRVAGELAVRDGWAGPAVERALRAALAESVQRGFDALASRCRHVLRAGGFAVPRFGDGDDDVPVDLRATGVTARELEIVRLLQSGLTTAEVAERLFVSVATVKSHVTHVMRKLGYRTRRELLAGLAVQT